MPPQASITHSPCARLEAARAGHRPVRQRLDRAVVERLVAGLRRHRRAVGQRGDREVGGADRRRVAGLVGGAEAHRARGRDLHRRRVGLEGAVTERVLDRVHARAEIGRGHRHQRVVEVGAARGRNPVGGGRDRRRGGVRPAGALDAEPVEVRVGDEARVVGHRGHADTRVHERRRVGRAPILGPARAVLRGGGDDGPLRLRQAHVERRRVVRADVQPILGLVVARWPLISWTISKQRWSARASSTTLT